MSFSFDAKRGRIIVHTELFGPSGSIVLRLALDPGATSTMVNVGPLIAIGYDPSLVSERVQVTTGSGVEYAPRIEISFIKALGQERAGLPVLSHTLPSSAGVDGLLGLDFLRGRTVTINFRPGNVTLR